jgi:hypothetical protein
MSSPEAMIAMAEVGPSLTPFKCSPFNLFDQLTMPKTSNFDFSEAKQDRSKQTLDDLLIAAYEIVEAANPDAFTSRSLSNRSGYALGTVSKRLGSVQNVFLWAIEKGREKNYENFARIIKEFNPSLTIQELIEQVIDVAFDTMKGVNPKVIRFFEDRLLKKNGYEKKFYNYVDILAKAYIESANKNQTSTFKIVSESEAILIFRSSLAFAERPFVDENPIAGSSDHRRIAIDSLVRMLAK